MSEPVRLRVDGVPVAEYTTAPAVDPRHGPRPYLHPVRTLGGVPVTDVEPADHRWHLGVSVAMQDVDGTNFWGGRTYVRGRGYTWLDDHGRIVHTRRLSADPDAYAELLEWRDRDGRVLVTERRVLAARLSGPGWRLSFDYELRAPADRDVTLGSPATNGRPDGAGYGGFFWRAAPGPATAFTATCDGEKKVNGSAEPWVALTGPGPYTLVFRGLSGDDRWFVRTGSYPGVCAALAFDRPLRLSAGTVLARRLDVLVVDGLLDRAAIEAAGVD